MSFGLTYHYEAALAQIFSFRREVEALHPFLGHLFPIVIVKEDQFDLYDLEETGRRYELIRQLPAPIPVPKGVRASFPLDFYDNRPTCVVTGEVFDSLEGYVTIFHEFIHCQQWLTCEQELKQTLGVYQQAQDRGDFMWEIRYLFPYHEPWFISAYRGFLSALERKDRQGVLFCRIRLREILTEFDWEYLVWQEWKEGFARWLENRMRIRLELAENSAGREEPFNRVSFYEGGARYIEFLGQRQPHLLLDIRELFHCMSN